VNGIAFGSFTGGDWLRAKTIMASMNRLRCVLAVRDLAASVAYYTKVLGMALDFEAPGWAFLSRGAFQVMLGECADAMPAHETGDHSYFAYVTVEAIDDLHAQVRANGADVMQPLLNKPWGMREFGVRTPDGHRIMFGQEL
jgi:uncharacterized glyoxalase superfamily protein PhnB